MGLTREQAAEFGKLHAAIHKEYLASGQDITMQRAAEIAVAAMMDEPEKKPTPRDYTKEIEVGDRFTRNDSGQTDYCAAFSATLCLVGETFGIIVPSACTLKSKRRSRPGDGFEHIEHPEWGIGVWSQNYAFFHAIADDHVVCKEYDRSKLRRVYAVRD